MTATAVARPHRKVIEEVSKHLLTSADPFEQQVGIWFDDLLGAWVDVGPAHRGAADRIARAWLARGVAS